MNSTAQGLEHFLHLQPNVERSQDSADHINKKLTALKEMFQEKSHEGVSLEETNNFVREEINKLAKEVMKKQAVMGIVLEAPTFNLQGHCLVSASATSLSETEAMAHSVNI